MNLRRSATAASVYCASRKAIAAAVLAYNRTADVAPNAAGLSDALIAAHHPKLKLDRSICLRDLINAADDCTLSGSKQYAEGWRDCIDWIVANFGSGD